MAKQKDVEYFPSHVLKMSGLCGIHIRTFFSQQFFLVRVLRVSRIYQIICCHFHFNNGTFLREKKKFLNRLKKI